MDIKNIYKQLEKAPLDSAVGIKHIALIDGKEWGYHVAEVKTKVTAHVHRSGDENYHVLKGNGEMNVGLVNFQDSKPVSVNWDPPTQVGPGDVFNIPEGYAHCLKNTGQEPILVIFVSAPEHFTTDRYLVDKL